MSASDPTLNVEAYLALDKYEVDEGHAHIELAAELSDDEFDKLVVLCPANLYKRGPEGEATFDYAGCLECGTCRIACEGTVVKRWRFPRPGKGVEYRYG